jgi:hydroxymethylglutaryl-CoA reductase
LLGKGWIGMSSHISRFPGFFNLPLRERQTRLAKAAGLSAAELGALSGKRGLSAAQANHMVENAIGTFALPLGVAMNFIINGREVIIPMVTEEPSVIAGASHMAKIARAGGGFQAQSSAPEMIGQIQILDLPDMEQARQGLLSHEEELLDLANQSDPLIKEMGGGARGLRIAMYHHTPTHPMMVLHVLFDTRDAMGANVVNTVVENLAPRVAQITGGRVLLRILSNLADRRLARATCSIPCKALGFEDLAGETVRDAIIDAWALASVDPYRAATHNKGIMNGVDAVVIATGNDWRAVEAGAHAYAAHSGTYASLSRWEIGDKGALQGELEMPLAVGIVGGATRVHPGAKACLDLMGVSSARELAEIIVCVGLAQNLAALRALVTEGIQRGHMELHARQVAIAAGAEGENIERIARKMVRQKAVHLEEARKLLHQTQGKPRKRKE